MKPSIKYEIKPLWVEVEYKGKKYKCHRDSFMAKFGRPIQDMSIEELNTITAQY